MQEERGPIGQQDDDQREEHLPDEVVHRAGHLDLEDYRTVVGTVIPQGGIPQIGGVVPDAGAAIPLTDAPTRNAQVGINAGVPSVKAVNDP